MWIILGALAHASLGGEWSVMYEVATQCPSLTMYVRHHGNSVVGHAVWHVPTDQDGRHQLVGFVSLEYSG